MNSETQTEIVVAVTDSLSISVFGPIGDCVHVQSPAGSDEIPVTRLLPLMPDLLKDNAGIGLLPDLVTETTVVKSFDVLDASRLIESGSRINVCDPAVTFYDSYGNSYRIAYVQDEAGLYYPAIKLVTIDTGVVASLMVPFVISSKQDILGANARANSTTALLRRAKADDARKDAEHKRTVDAAKALVESLNVALAFQRSRAELHQYQGKRMRQVLVQYASHDVWQRESDDAPALRLVSGNDGFTLAEAVLSDVAVAEAE